MPKQAVSIINTCHGLGQQVLGHCGEQARLFKPCIETYKSSGLCCGFFQCATTCGILKRGLMERELKAGVSQGKE